MKTRTKLLSGVTLASLYFFYCACTPIQWHFIDGVDLIFHEAGHTLFILFGQFIQIAMGSGFQILVPLSVTLYFFLNRQNISAAICLMWIGQNIVNISVYARDAIAMQLPLLGGDGVMHDWNYLLTTLHVLPFTPQIGGTIYVLGFFTTAVGIMLSFFFVLKNTDTRLPKN